MAQDSSAALLVIVGLESRSRCGKDHLSVRPSRNLSRDLVRHSEDLLVVLQYHHKAEEGRTEK